MGSATEVIFVNAALGNGDAEERLGLMADACVAMPGRPEVRPDIVAIQEVLLDPGRMALEGLCERLGPEYRLWMAPVYPGKEAEKVVAVVTRLPVERNVMVGYQGRGKRAQIVELQDDNGADLVLANAHMESSPLKEYRRMYKLARLARRLEAKYPGVSQLATIDFNALPGFPSVKLFKALGFVSAYESVYGHEPHHTYPTPLSAEEILAGGYSTPHQFQALTTLASGLKIVGCLPEERQSPSGLIRYTVDTIASRNGPRAVAAGLVYDEAGDVPPFSDHYGLWVSYAMPDRREDLATAA